MFKISERGSSVKTEILAGIVTFLSVAYILGVNPDMLSQTGMSFNGVFVATALAAGFSCIFMGLYANAPVILASGMGLNAVFTFSIVFNDGYTFQQALAAVFVSGVLFFIISITGLRTKIIQAIPDQLKYAIATGIGFFITFIGLKNSGLVVGNPETLVSLGDIKSITVLLSLFGLVITIILFLKNVKGAIFIGMIATAILGVITKQISLPDKIATGFSELDFSTFGAAFKGFDLDFSNGSVILGFVVIVFTLLFVDFFDTAGTLIAINQKTGVFDDEKTLKKAVVVDSGGTVVGSIFGTSSVTAYIESLTGVSEGGRTGLTAIVTGILFLLSLFISPLISAVAVSFVTAPALIMVGILMSSAVKKIEWDNLEHAIPSFFTIIIMILSFSVSHGISFGFLMYVLTKVVTGKVKDISITVWILSIIFAVNLYFH